MMINNNLQNNNTSFLGAQTDNTEIVKSFMTGVFSWMFLALAITAVTAYFASTSESFISMLIAEKGLSIFGWVIMLAPLGLVLLMSFAFNKLSMPAMMGVFILYSVLMGLSLSFIFLIYTHSSIFLTFVITAGTFGTMAVAGYVTKTDLTKFGSILIMALVGLIIASVVNYFMNSTMLDYVISIAGVLIFTGLTAYDVQKLKRMASSSYENGDMLGKIKIMGALTLYLDFINLFLFLLRIFGGRK